MASRCHSFNGASSKKIYQTENISYLKNRFSHLVLVRALSLSADLLEIPSGFKRASIAPLSCKKFPQLFPQPLASTLKVFSA